MYKIPYFRPPPIDKDIVIPKIKEILSTRIYSKGPYRNELENALKKYLGADFIISCGSGTAGLFILLKAAKEVYKFKSIDMLSFTWPSDLIIVEAAGFSSFQIHYCDIDSETWNSEEKYSSSLIEVDRESHFTLVQDTFGNIDKFDYENYMVDATHSLGNKNIGGRGFGEVISLAPTKMVSGGEGGIISTNDPKIAKKAIEIRDMSSRLPEISCVIALEYLNQLPENIKAKRAIAQYYRSHLPFQFQKIERNSTYSKVCFLCETAEESEAIIKKVAKEVECRKYYKPLVKGLKNSDYVYSNIICLPAWIGVDYKRVTETIAKTL